MNKNKNKISALSKSVQLFLVMRFCCNLFHILFDLPKTDLNPPQNQSVCILHDMIENYSGMYKVGYFRWGGGGKSKGLEMGKKIKG